LTFTVNPGEILGLLGPTAREDDDDARDLRDHPPTHAGSSSRGRDVVADPVEAKRQLAYVPDDRSFLRH